MEIAWRSRAFADESSSSASTAIVTTTSTRRHVGSAAHSLRLRVVPPDLLDILPGSRPDSRPGPRPTCGVPELRQ